MRCSSARRDTTLNYGPNIPPGTPDRRFDHPKWYPPLRWGRTVATGFSQAQDSSEASPLSRRCETGDIHDRRPCRDPRRPRARHRVVLERRHLPRTEGNVAGSAQLVLSLLRRTHTLVRQRPGLFLDRAARPLSSLPPSDLAAVSAGRTRDGGDLRRGRPHLRSQLESGAGFEGPCSRDFGNQRVAAGTRTKPVARTPIFSSMIFRSCGFVAASMASCKLITPSRISPATDWSKLCMP